MHCAYDSQIGLLRDVRGEAAKTELASCKTLEKRKTGRSPFSPWMRLERHARGGERYLGVQRGVSHLFLHPPRKNKVVHWRPLNARRRVSASRNFSLTGLLLTSRAAGGISSTKT